MEKKKPPFAVETATCRDILETTDPDHSYHSVNGAKISKNSIEIFCTCEDVVVMTPDIAEDFGWKFDDVVNRLKKLGATQRKKHG